MSDIDKKLFRDPSTYSDDRGLSNSDLKAPVKVTKTDASWMKASITENERSGLIIDAANHQSFVPYQTQFETKQVNTYGFVKQSDMQTPWANDSADQWRDTVNFPPDFRGIFDIKGWYSQKFDTNKELYQWKTDIFRNQYGLYKDFGTPGTFKTLYVKKHLTGEFWVCNSTGHIISAVTALSALFNNHLVADHQLAYSNLTSNNIEDIDVFYDVMMVVTPTEVVLDKILFDYETGAISSLPQYTHMIDLSADLGGKFADIWFFEDIKKVVFCNVVITPQGFLLPYIHELDLETDQFNFSFPLPTSNLTTLQYLSTYPVVSMDYPIFTYNELTKQYVVMLNAEVPKEDEELGTETAIITIALTDKEGVFEIGQVWSYLPASRVR